MDVSPIRLATGDARPFSGENWLPATDVSAFVSLPFEITIRDSFTRAIGPAVDLPLPPLVPDSVSQIFEDSGIARISAASVVRRSSND
jgi:hypothetical protein